MSALQRSITLVACLLVLPVHADTVKRSAAAILEFKRHNPCPATGQSRGSCPGYIIDHIKPLCAGGPDTPANMQWQTRADSLVKDADERRLCRAIRLSKPI